MFERFTAAARRVVDRTQESARERNHDYIGTEHLLLALIGETGSVAVAALESLGASTKATRGLVDEIIGLGEHTTSDRIPFTPRSKRVLQLAVEEADEGGDESVDTHHLLLGLIREGEGVAALVLRSMGVDLDKARRQLLHQVEKVRTVPATFRMVDRGPDRLFGQRFVAPIGKFIGVVLLLVGAAALAVLPLLAVIFLFDLLTTGDGPFGVLRYVPNILRENLWWFWPLAGAAILGQVVGRSLLLGRRALVLLLRRFGHTEATEAATFAATRLGRNWRFVTLDDDAITALAIAGGTQAVGFSMMGVGIIVSIVAPVIGRLVRLVIVVSAGFAVGSGLLSVVSDVSWAPSIFHISLGVLAGSLLLLAIGALLVMLYTPLLLMLFHIMAGIVETRDAKRHRIRNIDQLLKVRKEIVGQGAVVFGAKLMVLEVNSAIWQDAVTALAFVAALPLIDVSIPTENVLWEVRELLRRFDERCVFVGEAERMQALQSSNECDAVALRELLDDREVLVYKADRHGVRRFTRALRGTFEQRLRQPALPQEDPLQPSRV